MPYHPDEPRHPHLEFVREDIAAERRRRQGFSGPRLDRGGRAAFGQQLQEATNRIEQEQRRKPRPLPGIRPHLVFRVPFVQKPAYDKIAELFDRADMTVVSVESDGAIVVFREDAETAFGPPHAIPFEPKSATRGEGGYSRKNSTLQCGTFSMKQALQTNYGNDYWLVVRAERGWVTEEQAEQSYAVVVAVEADTPELYAQVRQCIRQRVRVRV